MHNSTNMNRRFEVSDDGIVSLFQNDKLTDTLLFLARPQRGKRNAIIPTDLKTIDFIRSYKKHYLVDNIKTYKFSSISCELEKGSYTLKKRYLTINFMKKKKQNQNKKLTADEKIIVQTNKYSDLKSKTDTIIKELTDENKKLKKKNNKLMKELQLCRERIKKLKKHKTVLNRYPGYTYWEREMKIHYPKLRKGTKRYKEGLRMMWYRGAHKIPMHGMTHKEIMEIQYPFDKPGDEDYERHVKEVTYYMEGIGIHKYHFRIPYVYEDHPTKCATIEQHVREMKAYLIKTGQLKEEEKQPEEEKKEQEQEQPKINDDLFDKKMELAKKLDAYAETLSERNKYMLEYYRKEAIKLDVREQYHTLKKLFEIYQNYPDDLENHLPPFTIEIQVGPKFIRSNEVTFHSNVMDLVKGIEDIPKDKLLYFDIQIKPDLSVLENGIYPKVDYEHYVWCKTPAKKSITVNIEIEPNKIISKSIERNRTFKFLAEKIRYEDAVRFDNLRFKFNGEILNQNKNTIYYGLYDECLLQIVTDIIPNDIEEEIDIEEGIGVHTCAGLS